MKVRGVFFRVTEIYLHKNINIYYNIIHNNIIHILYCKKQQQNKFKNINSSMNLVSFMYFHHYHYHLLLFQCSILWSIFPRIIRRNTDAKTMTYFIYSPNISTSTSAWEKVVYPSYNATGKSTCKRGNSSGITPYKIQVRELWE